MAISEHVEDLIVAIKAKPNSIWRNKAVSHAHDMLAALRMLELDELASGEIKRATEPLKSLSYLPNPNEIKCQCTIIEGKLIGLDPSCPIHGPRSRPNQARSM